MLMMFMTIILLVAVLIPGIGQKANGARSWIDLGFFNLQPTEFAKLTTIIYLASWFSNKERKRFFSFLFLIGVILGLVMLQPDLGTATVIYSLAVIIYFLAGVDLHYLMALIPLSLVGFLGLVFMAPYRFRRLTAFLRPHEDPQGVSYHINQILISLSQGGVFGRGLGASRQKYLFLPEAHTDSIFAILGEEFGFIGSTLVIFAFFVLLYKLYSLYHNTGDRFGKLLVGGVFAFFGLQTIINLGGMVGLMPLTGVPLPFISYGGSHLLISFMLLGIALNVSKQR
jgi:cell division protein FtsW